MSRFFQSFRKEFLESAFILIKMPTGIFLVILSLFAFMALTLTMFASGFSVLMMLFVAVMTGHVFISLFWAAFYFCVANLCAMGLRYFWGPMLRRWFGLPPLSKNVSSNLDEPFMETMPVPRNADKI